LRLTKHWQIPQQEGFITRIQAAIIAEEYASSPTHSGKEARHKGRLELAHLHELASELKE